MEKKTSYSLQDAKDSAAKHYGHESWEAYIKHVENHAFEKEEIISWLLETLLIVAELYKEKAAEELRKERDECYALLKKSVVKLDEYKAEIERLKESNKELVEGLEFAKKALTSISSFGATTPIIERIDIIIEKSKP